MTPHALSARDLVAVWEAGGPRHPVDRALLLLAAALPHRTHDELAALPVGRRDVLLLRVREATLGPVMACASPCPRCGARLEFRAVVGELLREAPGEDAPREHRARGGGVEMRFRLLDSRDLALSARTAAADEARRALLLACLLAVRPLGADGGPAAAAETDDSPAAVEARGGDLEGPSPAADAGRGDVGGPASASTEGRAHGEEPSSPSAGGDVDGEGPAFPRAGGDVDAEGSASPSAGGWGPPPAELDGAALAALGEALLAADPMMDLRFSVTCGCGHRWTTLLDPGVFVWSEVSAAAVRLLREVDRLARAYGWSEAEILEMSAARRGAYLELVP